MKAMVSSITNELRYIHGHAFFNRMYITDLNILRSTTASIFCQIILNSSTNLRLVYLYMCVYLNFAEIPGHVTEMDFCQEVTSQKIKWTRTLRGQIDLTSCPEGVTGKEYGHN